MAFNPAIQLLQFGSYIAVCIVGGTLGGYFLDAWLGTGSILTLSGLGLGLVAAFWGGYRMLTKTIADINRWQAREAQRKSKTDS